MQEKFFNNLRDFGREDMTGLMALIPQNIRQAAAGFTKQLADPLDKFTDSLQVKVNQGLAAAAEKAQAARKAKAAAKQ